VIYLNDEKLYTLALGLLQFRGLTARIGISDGRFNHRRHPAIIVFLLGQQYFIEGVTLSGMKL
jgi:multiple sugar transport system permease protein